MSYSVRMKTIFIGLVLLLTSTASHAGRQYVEYFHHDALGSIVAASDEQGDIIWQKTYDPYGNEVVVDGQGEEYEGQAYTGKPYDKETGLLYLGQRYYDPQLKRFLSMDPVGFKASNPTSFNRYAYANNNPYRFIDPDGRESVEVRPNILTRSLGSGQINRQDFQEFSEVPPEAGVLAAGGVFGIGGRGVYLYYLANATRANSTAIMAGEVVFGGAYAGSTVRSSAVNAAKGIRFGPLNAGPLTDDVARTFRGGSYTGTTVSETTTLYRVYGGGAGKLGPYWTRTKPSGPLQSQLDSALAPQWGNTANNVVSIRVPRGTTIYEGAAASQSTGVGQILGGGNQVYIPRVNPNWIK